MLISEKGLVIDAGISVLQIICNGIVSNVGGTCPKLQYGGGRSIIQMFCFSCAFLRTVLFLALQ